MVALKITNERAEMFGDSPPWNTMMQIVQEQNAALWKLVDDITADLQLDVAGDLSEARWSNSYLTMGVLSPTEVRTHFFCSDLVV